MSKQTSNQKEWYHLLDGFRGFALINMLFFHFYYDVYIIFGQEPGWYSRGEIQIWQQFICISFLLISGISWHFSRNNLKRGLLLNLYGLIITAVTYVFMPSQTVRFGILNCIGCATLLMIPLHKLFQHISSRHKISASVLGFGSALLLFTFTRNITDGYLGTGGLRLILPQSLYHFPPMAVLGFPYSGFRSSDYFPVLPWFFLFVAGYFLWDVISCKASLANLFKKKLPVLSRLGQKTIWIYMLHQPFLYAAAYLLIQVAGIRL